MAPYPMRCTVKFVPGNVNVPPAATAALRSDTAEFSRDIEISYVWLPCRRCCDPKRPKRFFYVEVGGVRRLTSRRVRVKEYMCLDQAPEFTLTEVYVTIYVDYRRGPSAVDEKATHEVVGEWNGTRTILRKPDDRF